MISLDNKLDNRTISDITAPDTLDLSCSGVCYDNQLPTAKRNGSVFFIYLYKKMLDWVIYLTVTFAKSLFNFLILF